MTKTSCRYVPTSTDEERGREWTLTENQWKVYYWLLMKSKWNAGSSHQPPENHYYIYDNDYTLKQIMHDLGIKNYDTLNRQFKALEKCGALQRCDKKKCYLMYFSHIHVPVSINIIKTFLNFDDVNIDLLMHLYTTLLLWSKNETPEFSITLMYQIMGRTYHSSDKAKMINCIALLSMLGLISFEKHSHTCPRNGVKVVDFLITKVKEEPDMDLFNEDDKEINKEKVRKIQEGIELVAKTIE